MVDFPNISLKVQNIVDSIGFIVPEAILTIGFILVILLDLFIKRSNKVVSIGVLLVLFLAFSSLYFQYQSVQTELILFNGMFALSKKIIAFKMLAVFVSIISVLFFNKDSRIITSPKGANDFYSIFLGMVLAMMALISSANLLLAFVSIEMLSIGSYLMVNYAARQSLQAESGLKYIIFGVAASAIMLYGISFIYGFSGTLDLYGTTISDAFQQVEPSIGFFVLILFMAGLGFKLSFVPFHFWTPDVYQEAPTSVTAFLSTVPKIAVFAFLFQLLPILQAANSSFVFLIAAAAIASMLIGNILAVFQDDAKRLMAFSSIGHTGFILMLFVLPDHLIYPSLFFYLVVYAVANMGVFMSLQMISDSFGFSKISQMNGLGKQIPFLGVLISVLMVSLIGLPPTAGFIAKFRVFAELISYESLQTYHYCLLAVAVITTVISLFYYFRLPLYLFLKKGDAISVKGGIYGGLLVLVVLMMVFVIFYGVFPDFIKI